MPRRLARKSSSAGIPSSCNLLRPAPRFAELRRRPAWSSSPKSGDKDSRGRRNPFAEISHSDDIEQLAVSLIPNGEQDPAREWRGYARTFVTAVIRRCWESGAHDLGELWRLLAVASSEELCSIVAGTPAQPFLEPNNVKMFSNIRSVAGSALGALEHIHTQRTAAFSVREWVRGSRGVLFIP